MKNLKDLKRIYDNLIKGDEFVDENDFRILQENLNLSYKTNEGDKGKEVFTVLKHLSSNGFKVYKDEDCKNIIIGNYDFNSDNIAYRVRSKIIKYQSENLISSVLSLISKLEKEEILERLDLDLDEKTKRRL